MYLKYTSQKGWQHQKPLVVVTASAAQYYSHTPSASCYRNTRRGTGVCVYSVDKLSHVVLMKPVRNNWVMWSDFMLHTVRVVFHTAAGHCNRSGWLLWDVVLPVIYGSLVYNDDLLLKKADWPFSCFVDTLLRCLFKFHSKSGFHQLKHCYLVTKLIRRQRLLPL